MNLKPPTLQGKLVRLEPLTPAHIPDLAAAGTDERIWEYMHYGLMNTLDQMRSWVYELLSAQTRGTDMPFTVFWQANQQVIGATRYLNISIENKAVEIGGTWYSPAYQRSGANTEGKYLMLKHAFESLGCVRVQFKTDLRNLRSQRALERIGAQREGVLRNHLILPNGRLRDSVFYSIIEREWPAVKSHLEELLRTPRGST